MLARNRAIVYNNNFNLTMIVICICSFWWHYSNAYKLASLSPDAIHINPNIRCPGKNEANIWKPCEFGGFVENPDPKNCDDRYVCYVGLNEICRRGDRCADNAICTVCGICQKCDNPDTCSDFNLCPNISGYLALNFIKRFTEKRLTEFDEK